MTRMRVGGSCGVAVMAALCCLFPREAAAHCDTMDGPVVAAAQKALASKDVTPVLRWIKADDEKEIREAFRRTLVVRGGGDDATQLADMYFFETLVRVHRAGEGEAYTGLKPRGTEIEPGVRAADKALESGSAEDAIKLVTDAAREGIQERFARAKEARAHADESVEAGRKAVAAYVEFTHYLERLRATAAASGGAHGAHAGHVEAAAQPGRSGWGAAALALAAGGLLLAAGRGRWSGGR